MSVGPVPLDVHLIADEPGATDVDTTEQDLPSEITGDPKENKIIAMGCSNLFKNDILQSVNSHKALLLNSVDALTLGDDLINIRSKNIAARRIKATSGVAKALSKAFVVWFPPLVLVGLGIFVTIKRKKR